jgi:hypothetical protein
MAHSAETAQASGARWRTAFMPFAVEALNESVRTDLLERVVGWLSPLGRSMLFADRTAARPGDVINYTAVLRVDEVITPALTSSHPVSLSIDLDDGLTALTSSLPGSGGKSAGRWNGTLRPGDVLTWTFAAQVDFGVTPGQALAATARFGLNDAGLRFSRPATVRVDAPDLTASLAMQPAAPDWRGDITVTVHLTNTSAIEARQAVLSATVPPSLTLELIPASAPADALRLSAEQLVLTITVPAGGVTERSYRITMPPFGPEALPAYQHAVVVDDKAGGLAAATLWLVPPTRRLFYPLMPQ